MIFNLSLFLLNGDLDKKHILFFLISKCFLTGKHFFIWVSFYFLSVNLCWMYFLGKYNYINFKHFLCWKRSFCIFFPDLLCWKGFFSIIQKRALFFLDALFAKMFENLFNILKYCLKRLCFLFTPRGIMLTFQGAWARIWSILIFRNVSKLDPNTILLLENMILSTVLSALENTWYNIWLSYKN